MGSSLDNRIMNERAFIINRLKGLVAGLVCFNLVFAPAVAYADDASVLSRTFGQSTEAQASIAESQRVVATPIPAESEATPAATDPNAAVDAAGAQGMAALSAKPKVHSTLTDPTTYVKYLTAIAIGYIGRNMMINCRAVQDDDFIYSHIIFSVGAVSFILQESLNFLFLKQAAIKQLQKIVLQKTLTGAAL